MNAIESAWATVRELQGELAALDQERKDLDDEKTALGRFGAAREALAEAIEGNGGLELPRERMVVIERRQRVIRGLVERKQASLSSLLAKLRREAQVAYNDAVAGHRDRDAELVVKLFDRLDERAEKRRAAMAASGGLAIVDEHDALARRLLCQLADAVGATPRPYEPAELIARAAAKRPTVAIVPAPDPRAVDEDLRLAGPAMQQVVEAAAERVADLKQAIRHGDRSADTRRQLATAEAQLATAKERLAQIQAQRQELRPRIEAVRKEEAKARERMAAVS